MPTYELTHTPDAPTGDGVIAGMASRLFDHSTWESFKLDKDTFGVPLNEIVGMFFTLTADCEWVDHGDPGNPNDPLYTLVYVTYDGLKSQDYNSEPAGTGIGPATSSVTRSYAISGADAAEDLDGNGVNLFYWAEVSTADEGKLVYTIPTVTLEVAKRMVVQVPETYQLRHPASRAGVPITVENSLPSTNDHFSQIRVSGTTYDVANELRDAHGSGGLTDALLDMRLKVPVAKSRGSHATAGRYVHNVSEDRRTNYGTAVNLKLASPSEAGLKHRLVGGKWFFKDRAQPHYFKEMDAIEVKS